MPKTITELEKPHPVFRRNDPAVAIQIGEVRNPRAEAGVRALTDVTTCLVILQFAEVTRKRQLLIVRDVLVTEYQHRMLDPCQLQLRPLPCR